MPKASEATLPPVALLDVNILIALLDGGHLHHATAMAWLAANHAHGWASCPLTQNGCLRILSLPSYPNTQRVAQVALRLAQATTGPTHQFWADDLSLLTPGALAWDRVLSSRQITDLYLLALAVQHGGRLVTLDRGIALAAVPGAESHHLVCLS
jgi:uncharacterized protein